MRNNPSSGADDARSDRDTIDEQAYLDRAYRLLASMTSRTEAAAADAARRAAGDWNATVAHKHLTRRVASLAADNRPLCFGRIDEDDGSPWYIGRRHVEDEVGDPAVVDWRAPVAVPFYRATFRDPQGLRRRRRFILESRRLLDVLDEDFDDPHASGATYAGGLPDPLLAELGRAREGAMHDIVATIAAEQDRIIRAPLDTPVVVQGGPGTGKTAVGLHRAAFLLYEHRATLERQGVLVLGPNRLFLAYIAQVLPSLGEVAVVQTTVAGLVGAWRVRAEDDASVAALKGDGRMAQIIRKACRAAVRRPDAPSTVTTRWGSVSVSATEIAEALDTALDSGGSVNQQRLRFRRALTRMVTATLSERRRDMVIDLDEIALDLRRDQRLQRSLDRVWPAQSAPSLIRSLLGSPKMLASSSVDLLTSEERGILHRRASSSVAAERWTEADLPLLDEAQAELSDPPRRYGHIVVDEAQDLSVMALRMVARRSTDGRSLTILGDLAQATAPGAVADWATTITALGNPRGAVVEELVTGYRVPRQIMDLANRLLATTTSGLPTTTSVREGDEDPQFRAVAPQGLLEAAIDQSARLLHRYASVGVIVVSARLGELSERCRQRGVPTTPPGEVPAAGSLSLLDARQAKGLEFDAVVVVDPAAFLAHGMGVGYLYIALTRAVQHLTVIHTGARPF